MESSNKRKRTQERQDPKQLESPESMSRSISPPRKRPALRSEVALLKSPFQLTHIHALSDDLNQDSVSLRDILGDPLISECWNFNYLHDVPFLMSCFDKDVQPVVKMHIVHGFWKNQDPNRLHLSDEASRFSNVVLHAAPMPEVFGTHHSKMMILLRQDSTAQVIIHTANSIPKDWTNMTNAVWRSPLLPRLPATAKDLDEDHPLGSGERFKADLLDYLTAYNAKTTVCVPLMDQLVRYDFSAIRAALVASVPGRHKVAPSGTQWGWSALRNALRQVPCQEGRSDIVIQISSMATLGPRDTWLRETLFKTLASSESDTEPPNFQVVFPTADEIRKSLDGYMSGASIHTKVQSPQQIRQLEYMRPYLCHWANDSPQGQDLGDADETRDAGRNRAAPHIKTYIRHGEESIDWALLTSANLSKQAWGEAMNASGDMRVASWEIGVLVWPELLAEDSAIVPTFQKDMPCQPADATDLKTIVGLRMPYSLPLQPYGPTEIPWIATIRHSEPDVRGRVWTLY